MTTALHIPDRYAPILDLLQDHHERRGHQGPVKACVAPECWDVLALLKPPEEQFCPQHNLSYGCSSCEEWVPAELVPDEAVEAQRHELAKALKSIQSQCQDALEEFAEEYAR